MIFSIRIIIEALARLGNWGINPGVIRAFYKYRLVCVSKSDSYFNKELNNIVPVNQEQQDLITQFENAYGCCVYHAIETVFPGVGFDRHCFILLFVSSDQSKWTEEREGIIYNNSPVYVYNQEVPPLNGMCCFPIKSVDGGLIVIKEK